MMTMKAFHYIMLIVLIVLSLAAGYGICAFRNSTYLKQCMERPYNTQDGYVIPNLSSEGWRQVVDSNVVTYKKRGFTLIIE